MANSILHMLPFPIANARYSLPLSFRVAAGTPTDPTTPDTEFSTDGGATFTDCAEEITTGGANGMGYLTLTGAETNIKMLLIASKSANCLTTPAILHPRQLPTISQGTLSAGSSTGGTLNPILAYDVTGCYIRTTGGTGGGGTGGANNQARRLQTYNTTTGVFTVLAFETTPSTDTTYDILMPEGMTLGALKALNPATAGRTLVVDANGLADANAVKGGPTGAGVAITANTITHLVQIYDTDYATVYDATNKAFLAKLGNFAMGGSSLVLTTGAIGTGNITVTGTLSTSGATTFNSLTVSNGMTVTGASGLSLSTLVVTGATTLTTVGTGNVTITGTLATTGTTTFNAFTVTGALTVANGIDVSCTTADRAAAAFTGNGTAPGVYIAGGNTASGLKVTCGAGSTDKAGFEAVGVGTTARGIWAHGVLAGIYTEATTGAGINSSSTGGNGAGALFSGNGSGSGISAAGQGGGTGHGILATGGSGATGDGIKAVATSTDGNGLSLTGTGTGGGLGVNTVKVSSTVTVAGATTLAGLATGALACTTITASGAVAFQSTFAVTTSTSLAALSATTVTFSGAVDFQSTFAVTTSTSLAALSCTTLTASGAVALQSTLAVTGATTLNTVTTGAVTIVATGNATGLSITGSGFGSGAIITGGATGSGVAIQAGGGGNGNGLFLAGTGSGDGLHCDAGIGGGVDIRGNITGNIHGTLDTLTTYTGNTLQTGDSYARIGAAGAGLTAVSLTAAGMDAVLVESGIVASSSLTDDAGSQLTAINARQALAAVLSACGAVLAGAGSSPVTIRPAAKPASSPRITATIDGSNNRTAVVLKVPT